MEQAMTFFIYDDGIIRFLKRHTEPTGEVRYIKGYRVRVLYENLSEEMIAQKKRAISRIVQRMLSKAK